MRAELRDLPAGYFHHGEKVLELVDFHHPRVCVELGTFKGASAVGVARLVRRWGGTVFCVDTWDAATTGEAGTLGICARNLADAAVAPWVRLIVASTQAAAAAWTGPMIDYLYVDADHTREGVAADLARWWPHLRVGGLIAGDDYDNPDFPGVTLAWDAFEHELGQTFGRFATPDTSPAGMRLIYGTKQRGGA